jgi:hypothetical protein
MKPLIPWTREEIAEMLPRLRRSLDEIADAQPHDVRPLPMLTYDECHAHIVALVDATAERPLTESERFLFGQLLCQFAQASVARHLGVKGRCYVIHEDAINRLRSAGGSE